MNNTVQYLVEGITKDILCYIVEEQQVSIEEALYQFHNSETFEKLCNEATGLYIESPDYVYEIYKDEMKMGKIV